MGPDEQGHPITRNIEDLQVGDSVLSKDEHGPDAPVEQKTVTAVEVHTVYAIRLLGIAEADGSTETLQTTDEHPFWVLGTDWVKAGDLHVGQTLLTPDGRVSGAIRSPSPTRHPCHPSADLCFLGYLWCVSETSVV